MVQDDGPVGPDGVRVCFDDERVVADAGVVLVATLAQRLGIEARAGEIVRLPRHLPGAANAGRRIMALVYAMVGAASSSSNARQRGRSASMVNARALAVAPALSRPRSSRSTTSRSIAVASACTSSAGTSRPLRPSSMMSDGPVGQSHATTAMPLLIASSSTRGKPSNSELRTKIEARGHLRPEVARGGSERDRFAQAVLVDDLGEPFAEGAAAADAQAPVREPPGDQAVGGDE
jgi:hypothetical protein